jgi:hypothetical protein
MGDVYAYASDPRNLAEWAPGLGRNVVEVDGLWYLESDSGRLQVVFAPRNEFGVLDHWVTQPDNTVVYVPFRVIAWDVHSEVVFSLRRDAQMSDAEYDRDAGLVLADLLRLKQILEHG